jgi:aminopeptidase N
MRSINYSFLFIIGSFTFCSAQTTRSVDITSYSFAISLNDSNDSLIAIANILFTAIDTTSTITLDLATINKDKKGMKVQDVILNPRNGPTQDELPFKHENDKLVIALGRTIPKGQGGILSITYSGIPSDGLIISRNRFKRRTFFSDNWPNRAHFWIPCVDDPSDKATVEFIVRAPSHYQVVANGKLIDTTILSGTNDKVTRWKENVAIPSKIMVIGVADFAIKDEGNIKGVPVSTWVYSDNAEKGFYDYAPAKDILAFFIEYIGPYPYEKLANVQSLTIFGGMENASAIFYNENYVNGKQDQYTLMSHEIAHQWFGDMATEKSYAHLWLSEGFATCLSILYMEKKFGADTARFMREDDRKQVIGFVKNWDRPVVDSITPTMQLLNVNSYQKGGWVLHMLRHQLGDSVFQKCIRTYYADYAGKNAGTPDLENVFEKVSGKDLSVFFREWLYTPGIPRLDIKWKYNAKNKKILVTVQQLQKSLFHFPLELLIKTSKGSQITTIRVNEAQQSFSIPVKQSPVEVTTDPGINLLFEGNTTQMK